MKRLFEFHQSSFPGHNTYVTLDWADLPQDVDFSEYNTRVMNVLHPDCHLSVIDDKRNGFYVTLPKTIRDLLFLGHQQSLNAAISILRKLAHEQEMIHQGKPISYDNIVA